MRLQKLVIAGILVFFFFVCPKARASMIEVSGTITSDTTWTGSDTILVMDSVIVEDLAELTIEPGTIILFRFATALYIEGGLTAIGETTNRIQFTSSTDTIGGSPVAGDWFGLSFLENSTGILTFCNLHYAFNPVQIARSTVELYGCIIENFSSRGISIDGLEIYPPITTDIENCIIRQSAASTLGSGSGIYVYRLADVTITLCDINNCRIGFGFYGKSTYAPTFQISRCEIHNHLSQGILAQAGG